MPSDDFTRLVDAYYAPLYRFALSLAKNSSDASDLTQQTFLVWAKKGHELRDEAKVKSWLFTTLYREFLRLCRRSRITEPLDDTEISEAELAAPVPDLLAEGQSGTALEAMHAIDEVFRVPLTLHYLQEFSYREIAEMLSVPIGTVMSRLARGRAQLRDVLARKKLAVEPARVSSKG